MNKKQAENILDGYLLIFSNPNMEDAANALREIILDAMSDAKTSGYVSTYPHTITVPTNTGTGYPAKPSTTYTTIRSGE